VYNLLYRHSSAELKWKGGSCLHSASPNHSNLSRRRKEEDEQEILLAMNAVEPLAPISWLTYSLDWTSYSRGEQGLLIGHGASLHAGQNAMI
jgi:hypothetical protein